MTPNNITSEPDVLELFSLRSRVAVVTGGTGHLGSVFARTLAEAGSRVIITSRDASRADTVAKSLPSSTGEEHFGVALNHTDAASIDECVEAILERAGQIDVLVNNAHAAISNDWESVTSDEFSHHFANITAYFLLARHVRNRAVERSASASIVMLGSMYGLVGSYPDAYEGLGPASPAAYHALKGGVVQLTRHLAVYWAKDNVRVNCLSPGPFPSNTANSQMVARLAGKSPMARMGKPYELKGALLLLASDAGSYITGQNLIVDGGWTAW
jgi:NAD(P)-dependent dehydrogenase (short-subunit alcohol dehydrogenase family)